MKVLRCERHRNRCPIPEGGEGRDVLVYGGARQSRSRARRVPRREGLGWRGRRRDRARRPRASWARGSCGTAGRGGTSRSGGGSRCGWPRWRGWCAGSGGSGRSDGTVGSGGTGWRKWSTGARGSARASGRRRRSWRAGNARSSRAPGAQGNPGSPGGLEGYELVSTDSPIWATVSANGNVQSSVSCPTGKRVLAGGFEPMLVTVLAGQPPTSAPGAGSVVNLNLTSSGPTGSGDGWSVSFRNLQGTQRTNVQFRIWAVCVVQP